MNRQGIVFTRPRDTISFFAGVFLTAVGLIPLLVSLKVIGWTLPGFLTNLLGQIAIWIIAVAGLYVVIDGFIEPPAHNLHWFLIAAGLVLFLIGLLPILFKFGVLGFNIWGAFSETIRLILYQTIITVEGLLLMIGGLTEH